MGYRRRNLRLAVNAVDLRVGQDCVLVLARPLYLVTVVVRRRQTLPVSSLIGSPA